MPSSKGSKTKALHKKQMLPCHSLFYLFSTVCAYLRHFDMPNVLCHDKCVHALTFLLENPVDLKIMLTQANVRNEISL